MKKFFALIAALIFFTAQVEAAELVIFHTNDMHSRVEDTDDSGKSIGLAEIAAAVKAAKAANPETFWFDAGDTFHGLPKINVSKGENMVPLLNIAGVDFITPGNHDFNYGLPQLERLAKKIKFPMLSANVVRKKNGKPVLKPYKIFKLKDKTRVGVFGLTTPETAYKTNPKNVETVEFLDPVKCAREMIKKLQPKCDVIIAVMHMGVDDSSEFTSERIAREAPGIDVIIDGHSHTELPEGIQVGDTLIAQTGCYEHLLGRVTLEIEDREIVYKKAELLTDYEVKALGKTPDAEILQELKNINARNEKIFNQVVGHSDKRLVYDRNGLRTKEMELGDFCADAFRQQLNADIAIVNAGVFRADLPDGDVTYKDLLRIFPYSDAMRKAEISGAAVREMLENSVSIYPKPSGGFLSVSGVTFAFDPSQPSGHRVSEIFIGGKPLDESKIYTITATNFQFLGGEGYTMLKGLKMVGDYGTCEQILADYLSKIAAGEVTAGEIGQGRIINLHEEELAEAA